MENFGGFDPKPELSLADKKQRNIEVYNQTADQMAEKFSKIGPRIEDINKTFSKIDKDNPSVLEIGCGTGRDASEIAKHTNSYLGVDISEGMLEVAKQENPDLNFEVADIENFDIPKDTDVIFAFASLIHLPKEELAKVLDKAHESLSEEGLIYLSMKGADHYQEVEKTDQFGTRTYFHYSLEDLRQLVQKFEVLEERVVEFQSQHWVDLLIQKS